MRHVAETGDTATAGFRFPEGGDVRADLRDRYGYGGELLDIYAGMKGPRVHKWHDIDPRCARFDGRNGSVRSGGQDAGFLGSVGGEMGGVDIVLDDGSHQMAHIRASLEARFPRLATGGIYMIEDLQTACRPSFGGGLDGSGNFFNTVRELIDDIHGWHHTGGPRLPALAGFVAGVHVHDGLVAIDKAEVVRPTHSKVGGKAAEAAPGPRRRVEPRGARLARQEAE